MKKVLIQHWMLVAIEKALDLIVKNNSSEILEDVINLNIIEYLLSDHKDDFLYQSKTIRKSSI